MRSKHHIDLFWPEDDGARIADAAHLKPCSAFGDTHEEALLEIAIDAGLGAARDRGLPIPEPHNRPAVYAAE